MLVCDRVVFRFRHPVVVVVDDGDDINVYCSCCLADAEMNVNNICKNCYDADDFDAIEKDDAVGNNTNCGSDWKLQ